MVHAKDSQCFQPEELRFLKRLFDRICSETTAVRGPLFEELLAASLIHLYQSGNRDVATLLELGRLRVADLSRQPRSSSSSDVCAKASDCPALKPRTPGSKRKMDPDRLERANRESRVLIDAERQARDVKTARLRELRLKVDLEPKQ